MIDLPEKQRNFLPHNALGRPVSLYFQAGPLPLLRALFVGFMAAVS